MREFNISAFVNYEKSSDTRLVVSVEKKGTTLYRQELGVLEKIKTPNEWAEITLSAIIPEGLEGDAELKIYFWNPAETSAFVDDFSVQFCKGL